MIRIRINQIRTDERKTVGEEVKEYSEVANKIIERRLAEQRREEAKQRREEAKAKSGEKDHGETEGGSADETPGKEDEEAKVIIVKHKVTMGDQYKTLALRYHTKTGVIKKWNKISRPLKYMIGRELSIPVGLTYVEKPPEDLNVEAVFPHLMKAFLRVAKDCEPARARYYLLDCDRDLKKALARWREDDKWEKSAEKKQAFKVLKSPKTENETATDVVATPGEEYKPPQFTDDGTQRTIQKSNIQMQEIAVSNTV